MKDMNWMEYPVSTKSRFYHTASLVDNKVIIYGGRNLHESLSDVQVFDLIKETWTSPTLPGLYTRQNLCSAVDGSSVYFFGGKKGINWLNLYNDVSRVLLSESLKPQNTQKDILAEINQELFGIGQLSQQEISKSKSKDNIQQFLGKENEETQKFEALLSQTQTWNDILPLITDIKSIRNTLSKEAHSSKGNLNNFDKLYNQTVESRENMLNIEKLLNEKKTKIEEQLSLLQKSIEKKRYR